MLNSRTQATGTARNPGKNMAICILSGLKIPYNKKSIEHYCPRSKMPPELAESTDNKFLAIAVFNNIKGARFPCEWEALKYDLCFYAYTHYNLRTADRKLVRTALNGMPIINPCDKCICHTFKEYCIKER